jgi:hypothetical protein
MKTLFTFALMAAAFVSLPAHARKDCEELKREIATKIDANGVKAYQLEILDTAAQSNARTVGVCNGGTRRIVYLRAAPSPILTASSPPPSGG